MRTKESLLSFCRVQPILCKDSANEDKGKLVFALLSAAYLMQKYDKKIEKKALFYFTKRIASGSTVIKWRL